MYADKDKQRESDRERAKAYRLRKKGVTRTVTPDDIIRTPIRPASHRAVTPEFVQGMGNWAKLRGKANAVPLPPRYAVDDKPKASNRVHALNCSCWTCKPPKGK
jgi:hypothetical protein